MADALAKHGFKHAAEEIRLKIPRREFHGWDSAFRGEKRKNEKKADNGITPPLEPQADPSAPVEQFTAMLRNHHVPGEITDGVNNPLDRDAVWSGPSSLGAGDAGSRVSDMGQPTNVGMV